MRRGALQRKRGWRKKEKVKGKKKEVMSIPKEGHSFSQFRSIMKILE
jgi:hypothetical protein